MPFNPNLPQQNTLVDAAQMRDQLNGLKALSDAAIAGTALNPSGIGPFGGGFSDPPTQAEMDAFAAYVESIRAALVR